MSSWYILKFSLVFSPEKINGIYNVYSEKRNVAFQVAFTVALYNLHYPARQDAIHLAVFTAHFAKNNNTQSYQFLHQSQ